MDLRKDGARDRPAPAPEGWIGVAVRRARVQLKVLNELLAIGSPTRTAEEILDQSLTIVLGSLDETVGGIYLVHGEGNCLQLMAHRGLAPENLDSIQRLEMGGVLWQACAQGTEAVSLPRESSAEDALQHMLMTMGHQWLFVLPLEARDRRLGCLWVSSASVTTLDREDKEFLNIAGRAVGLAIDNSRLYEQMEHRLRESEALYKVSRALASTLNVDDLLSLIVRSAVDTIAKAKNCVLHLLDEESGELRPRALSFVNSVRPNVLGRSRMRIGQGVAGYALETGQVVNIPDVSQDPRFLRVGKVRPFASMLVAPLRLSDRRVGTLSIDSEQTYAFSQSDERLMMTLATQAAAAIENARLVANLKQSLADLRAAQEQLIQSEKLSAIGQLIAGVAHELNNPLTAIMGYAQLLQATEGVSEGVLRDLGKIYLQAQRAAKIVHNLLTFARQHPAERKLVDVSEVLERTLEMRSYQLRVDNIEVTTQFAPQELKTMADANQLQQVFLNLINNAQDAMTEHRGGGHLLVSTELEGNTIRIKLADDGPGLLPEAQKHIFEPFFTTKDVGRGTGLGLSICFGIISQHGGQIRAESEPDKGATFIIELPAINGQSSSEHKVDDGSAMCLGTKLVLVVEDEEDVAGLLQRVLRDDGHQVVLADNGEAALAHLAEAREQGTQFDLIISDIKMPGMGGSALYERMLQDESEMVERLVFITGDTISLNTQSFLQRVELPHLAKPFTVNDLRQVMIDVLGV
jgi:signal transduction histidine kinase/CheY-like chemotaxis protein